MWEGFKKYLFMPKPICIFRIDTKRIPELSGLSQINRDLSKKMEDYYVFTLPLDSDEKEDSVKIEVFYEKDFTKIQYDELRNIIEESLEQK